MTEPFFLNMRHILRLHERSLALYGGQSGIRDRNAIESAMAAPHNAYQYSQEEDLVALATIYAIRLSQCQGFLDGNKRTGAASAIAFLRLNGVPFKADKKLQLEIAAIICRYAEVSEQDRMEEQKALEHAFRRGCS